MFYLVEIFVLLENPDDEYNKQAEKQVDKLNDEALLCN